MVFATFALGPAAISGMNILVYGWALAIAMWLVVAAVAFTKRGRLSGKPLRAKGF
jgi:hypothetical protein